MAQNNNDFSQFDTEQLSKELEETEDELRVASQSLGDTEQNQNDQQNIQQTQESDFSQFDTNQLSEQITEDGQINLPEEQGNRIDLPETDFQNEQPSLGPPVTSEDIQQTGRQPEFERLQPSRQASQLSETGEDVSNTAKVLADSIKQVESGGDPTAQGASGESGAFQFMPGTWEQVSKEVAGQELEQTPENEQMVAEVKIDQLLEEGNTPREAALIWNTSLGGEEEPKEIEGVNEQGVEFDSGQYANQVMEQFERQRQGAQTQQQTQFNIQQLAQDQSPGFLDQATDFAGDVISETPEFAQDVGGGALNLAEGLGRAALSPIDTTQSLGEGLQQAAPRVPSMLAAGASGIITAGQEVAELPWEGLEKIVGEENYEAVDFQEEFSTAAEDWLDNQAKKFSERFQENVQQGQQFGDDFSENLTDPDFLAQNLVGRNLPTMVPTAVASLAGGLPAAIVAGGTLEGGAAMNELRQFAEETGNEELLENDALQSRIMGGVGIGAGMLDALGIESVLNKTPLGESVKRGMYGRIARDVAKGVVGEGATEPLQEIVANAAAQTYNENRGLFEGGAEALVAGGLTGGAGSIVSSTGAEWVAQGMPVGMSIRDVSDQPIEIPEQDRDKDPGEILDQLEQNSQQVPRSQMADLNQRYDNLSEALENNPARKLQQFSRNDGTLSENARDEIDNIDGIDSFEEARIANRVYNRQKKRFDVIEEAVKSGQFSLRQVRQKERQAVQRTETRVRKEAEREIREAVRNERDNINEVIDKIENFGKEYLPKENRDKIRTLTRKARNAAKEETRNKRVNDAVQEIRRESNKIQKKRLRKDIRSIISAYKDSPSIAPRFRQRIQNALSDVDLTGLTESKRKELESAKEFLGREGESNVPSQVLEKVSRLEKRRFEDISPEELQGIRDELERLVQLGRTKRQVQEGLFERQKEEIALDLIAQDPIWETIELEGEPEGVEPEGLVDSLRRKVHNAYLKGRQALQRFDKGTLPINALFRLAGGAHEQMKRRIDRAELARDQRIKKHKDRVNEFLENKEMSQKELREIGVFLAREREGGTVRLKQGNGLTQSEIENIELNETQREFAEMAYDILESFRDDVDRTSRELDNKNVDFEENYFPFLFSPDAFINSSERAVPTQSSRILPEDSRPPGQTTKQTEKGFTKQTLTDEQVRNDDEYPPLDLNAASALMRSITDMAHYTEVGRTARQYYEVVNSDEYKQKHGQFMNDEMTQWLSVVATQGGFRDSTRIPWLDTLKNNTTAATLGLKASTAIIQTTALADAMLEVNPKNLSKGLYQIVTNKKAREFVDKMPEIEQRVAGESALKDLQGRSDIKNKIVNWGFKPLTSIDTGIAKATALGAYLDYAEQNNIEVDLDSDPNEDGILYAQEKTEATMSNNAEKDKPLALSAGNLTGNKSVDNVLFQFQSFMLRRWAQFRVDAMANGIAGNNKLDGVRRLALISTALTIESGILMQLNNILEGDDEEQEEFMGEMARNAMQFVPLGGNAMSSIIYRSSPVPAMSFLNQGMRNVTGAVTAEKSDTRRRNAIEGFMQGLGMTTGLPGTIAQSKQVADRLVPEGGGVPSSGGGGQFDTSGFDSGSGFESEGFDSGGF